VHRVAFEIQQLTTDIQRHARNFFHEILGIDEDEDFAGHEPVSTEALARFAADPANGPDLADLHFDVDKGMRSEWNKAALGLMQIKFCAELSEHYDSVPARSSQYFEQLIQEKFQRLVGVWKRAQPRMTASGEPESHEAVETRMMSDKDVELKVCRHTTRRLNVSQHWQ
jgi:hypothetical protein